MDTSAYDDQNVFAKILRGEMPSQKIYEDDKTYAFMDIMPRSDGHSLVIPKSSARNLLDASPADLAAVMETVQRIGQASLIVFKADGLTIQQFNGEAAGQIVFHLHVHILPRWDGVKLRPHTGEMAEMSTLAEHAELLKAELR